MYVTTNDWADMSVMVVVPDGTVKEAVTTDVGSGERKYTYTMSNLFIEDAGVYTFYASRFGEVSSNLQNITVYCKFVAIYRSASVPAKFVVVRLPI